jgi:hypothetical protein
MAKKLPLNAQFVKVKVALNAITVEFKKINMNTRIKYAKKLYYKLTFAPATFSLVLSS